MKRIDWFTVSLVIMGISFLVFPLPAYTYMEYGINGGNCRDLQFGKRVKTEGGRIGSVVDCRTQDNMVNTEAYATVKFDDDGSVKEIHWSHLRLL